MNACTFEERLAQSTANIRTRANVKDLSAVFAKAYGAILQYLEQQGVQPAGMPYAAYFNQDKQNLDLEIGFPVATEIGGNEQIKPGVLPGGLWATLINVGPYDSVGPAWDALSKAIAERGSAITGAAYEFYLDGPETPPEKIRTLVAFPIK